MPRFYFHVFDDVVSTDEEGQVADDLEAARTIAMKSARELVCEQVRRGYLDLDNYIVVANQSAQELFRVVFREAFVVQRKSRPSDV